MDRIRNNWLTWLAAGLLGALTLAAYWPVLGHGFTSYDDFDYVTENTHVQAGLTWDGVVWAFRSTDKANWHPITWLSHMLDVQVFGSKAGGHHLTSLLLHIANTLLLFFLLHRLTASRWPSAFVAALFALHPLHVESVAWVAERKDVLSAFFFLLTLMAYAEYATRRTGRRAREEEKSEVRSPKSEGKVKSETRVSPVSLTPHASRLTHHGSRITHHASRFISQPSFYYILSLLLFALGLMSKPMVVTLPCVLLLLDYWPLNRGAERGMRRAESRITPHASLSTLLRLVLEKLPFFILSGFSCVITFVAQNRGGTVSSLQAFSLSSRVADACAAYLKYLGKAVWPANLAVYYPHPSLNPVAQWPSWQMAAAALALAGITLLVLLRRKTDAWLAVGWFWYLGMMVPVIGLVQVGNQEMADRYTYLPMIGIFICVVYGLSTWLSAWPEGRVTAGVVGVAVVLAGAGLTRRQVNYWKDDSTLFGHALAVNERNAPALHALGYGWAARGKYAFARVYCRAAVQADPSTWAAWHTLGDIAALQGKPREALEDYRTALRGNPRSAQTWFKLGYVQATLGNFPEALQPYQEALRLKPDYVSAHTDLGVAWLSLGKREDALKEFAEAVRLKPQSPETHYNLGTTLTDAGRLADGEAQLAEAVRLKPDYVEAVTALAGVLLKEGRTAEAEPWMRRASQDCGATPQGRLKFGSALLTAGLTNEANAAFGEAKRLEPNLSKLLLASGESFVARGALDEAEARFQALVWIQPDSAGAHERFGLLLANRGKLDQAVSHLKDALRLAPSPEAHYNLALALGMQGNLEGAITNYNLVLKDQPDSAPALNDLAWIRATAPNAALRNGPDAVRLAEHACDLTRRRNPRFLGTLAAAYAEAGRFAEAIPTAQQALDLALAARDKSLAENARARLRLYQDHQPYRQ